MLKETFGVRANGLRAKHRGASLSQDGFTVTRGHSHALLEGSRNSLQRPPGGSSKSTPLVRENRIRNRREVRASENGRRTAGLPKRSFNHLQQFHISGRFRTSAPGPISRPYPTREPLLIGAPRAGSAEPTDGQAIAASGTTIRNCIQCRQEAIKLCPRYSTFAQHPPRLSRDTLLSRSRCGLAAVGPSVNVICKLIEREP